MHACPQMHIHNTHVLDQLVFCLLSPYVRIIEVSLVWSSYSTHVHRMVFLQMLTLHYKTSIVCIHSDPHPSGPIIGLATCFGIFFTITIAMSTVLLVSCVISSKKRRSDRGKYIYIGMYI